MKVLLEQNGKRVIALNASELEVPENSLPLAPFVCLFWDLGSGPISVASEAIVSALVDAGCRYFMAAGKNAEAWEILFDAELCSPTRDQSTHVMTSHEGESLEDILFFMLKLTSADDFEPREFCTVDVNSGIAAESFRSEVEASLIELLIPETSERAD
jgi:hypothetical protein